MSYSNFHPFHHLCACVCVSFDWIRCKEKAASKFGGKSAGCRRVRVGGGRREWIHMICQLVHKVRTDDRQQDLEELDKA